jgi:hypothetical protein
MVKYIKPNAPKSYLLVDAGALGLELNGWCVDVDGQVFQNTNMNCLVYSSLTDDLTGVVDKPENIGRVNWILNNIKPGMDFGNGPTHYMDIQNAIWALMDDDSYQEFPLNPANIQYIIETSESHADFKPDCREVYGVILLPDPKVVGDDHYQTIMVEREVKCNFGEVCLDACAFGYSRYCLDIPGHPDAFWHWVTTGYTFCCDK